MKGLFLLVWLALASQVRTKPCSGCLYLEGNEHYYNGYEDYKNEDYYENYGNGYPQDFYDYIQSNRMRCDYVKELTFSSKSSHSAQLYIVKPFLVTKMEALRVFIQDKVAIAQEKQKAGEDFAYDSNDLNNLWDSISQSPGGPLRSLYKDMLQKYITTFRLNLSVFMKKEAMLEGTISSGIDSLTTYTQQKDWRIGEVSQLEEDAECFYGLMKSEMNYTMDDMTKEDFGNVARNLAHSLHVIATSSGIKTSITDIALDAANKLKTVNFEEIKNYLFEAIDIVSDDFVEKVEILDRALQFGVWKMALGDPVLRLDNLILKVIEIVKSDNFWIKTEQIHWKTTMQYIEPVMLNMVDLVAELSNEVDIAFGMEAFAAVIEEAIGSANIDGQEIAATIEQYLFTNIEEYLLVLENLGSSDLASIMPLMRRVIENTKPVNDHEAIRTHGDQEDIPKESLSYDDNGQDAPKEVSTNNYEELQERRGSIADQGVSKGSISKLGKMTSRDGYEIDTVEDILMLDEEQSSDDKNEIVEDVLINEEEDSSDGYKDIVEEDVSVIGIQDSNSVEENGNENKEIEEANGFVYYA